MVAFCLKRQHKASPFEVTWSQKFILNGEIFTVIGNPSYMPLRSFNSIHTCLNIQKELLLCVDRVITFK